MSKPPLWKVIDEAITETGDDVLCNAASSAAIRALRDWLVPEETEPTGMRPCGDTYSAQSIRRGERQRLRALLTAEADRAERGEVE